MFTLSPKAVGRVAWVGIAAYLLLIAPIGLGLSVEIAGVESGCVAAVRVWGVRVQVRFRLGRDAAGRLRLLSSRAGRPERQTRGHGPALLRVLRAVAKGDKARLLLQKGISLRQLRIRAVIGGRDAARVARITGLFSALCACAPGLDASLRPDFQGKTRIHIRCIACTRLGTLLAACALGALSFLRAGKKEEPAWIIPSDT